MMFADWRFTIFAFNKVNNYKYLSTIYISAKVSGVIDSALLLFARIRWA